MSIVKPPIPRVVTACHGDGEESIAMVREEAKRLGYDNDRYKMVRGNGEILVVEKLNGNT